MNKTTSMACAACSNPNHCSECSTYMQSPIVFKVSLGSKKATASKTSKSKVSFGSFTRMPNVNLSAPVQVHSACSQCESKHCIACSMYNTQFVQY